MIVVDAGVLASALGDDGLDGTRIRTRLLGEDLAAPEIVDLEITSVFRKLVGQERYLEDRANQAMSDLAELRMMRISHRPLVSRCWELRNNLTPYDAAYVAVAELLNSPLITADRRLANAPGPTCHIELVL